MLKVKNPNKLPLVNIQDVMPFQHNLKDLSEKNYEKLKNVLLKRGFDIPLFVWESEGVKYLMDGHGRQRVMLKEGWLVDVPYINIEAKDRQEAASKLLEITSQYQTTTQEGIDEFIAKYELNEAEVYEATSFDALTNYATDEPEKEVEEDEAPEVTENPVSELGKIYQLGRHRVMCGDSTDKANVELLMNGIKPDAVHTDPPYGLGKKMSGGTWATKASHYSDMHTWDKEAEQAFFDTAINQGCDAIVWGGNYFITPPSRGWLIWKKPHFPTMADCEIAYTTMDMNARVLDSNRSDPNKLHPTQKPMEVTTWALGFLNGENILDLFLGSGSTLIACDQTDRTCYGMELDPKYVDVIRKRYAKFIQSDNQLPADNQLPENWEELTPEIERG